MIDPAFKQEHEFARCKYPSKICRNVRTRKRNGQLHRFCEEHRTRANINQKRWSASRQKRWDALANELGQGFEQPQDGDASSPCSATAVSDAHDALTGQLPFLSLDDYDYDVDYEFTPEPIDAEIDLSWQQAATDELREFLGDLLLSIASDDAPPAAWSTARPSLW